MKPVIHRDYRGGDIVLPGDPSQVLTMEQNPLLATLCAQNAVLAVLADGNEAAA